MQAEPAVWLGLLRRRRSLRGEEGAEGGRARCAAYLAAQVTAGADAARGAARQRQLAAGLAGGAGVRHAADGAAAQQQPHRGGEPPSHTHTPPRSRLPHSRRPGSLRLCGGASVFAPRRSLRGHPPRVEPARAHDYPPSPPTRRAAAAFSPVAAPGPARTIPRLRRSLSIPSTPPRPRALLPRRSLTSCRRSRGCGCSGPGTTGSRACRRRSGAGTGWWSWT